MSNQPFFSIIIPSYNRAAFLSRSIASVQIQTFRDFEVLVIDDGSLDNTKEVIDNLIVNDPRIRYLYQSNAERGAARNKGIRNAKGTYIVFFDSDDEMKRDYLLVLYDAIVKHPEINFFAAKYDFLRNGYQLPSSMTPLPEGTYNRDLVLKGNPFACNFCIKRENPKLIFFEEDRTLATTEDWMFLVANLFEDQIYIIDKVALLMHQHEGRSMQLNQMLIQRRLKAAELLCSRGSFSEKEKKVLRAYSYHFCSVHAYLDHQEQQAILFLKVAVKLMGWNKTFVNAYIKYIIGRSFIERLKSLLHLRK